MDKPATSSTLNSMTGFARSEGSSSGCTWAWEAKSVNAKGLDVRVRLPRGFEGLEPGVREAAGSNFRRGNISISLEIDWGKSQVAVSINEEVLESVLVALAKIQDKAAGLQPASMDGLLATRGVLEYSEETLLDDERARLEAELVTGLDEMMAGLARSRGAEGEKLGVVLSGQLDGIDALQQQAAKLAATQPAAIRARLDEQVRELMAGGEMDAQRLSQEVALLAAKADIREELDRLAAHVRQARDLLADPDPAGRRLDFLCQEFNREANTLCSKSADIELTRAGLDLKALIEQFREQIQNIE